jgi:endo-1,4-beta-xylanase
MFSLAQSLLAQGVPLGGIGFESHFILGQIPSDMQANMQRFANLGLDVAVTELDDRITLPASSANLTQQATEFSAVVKDCLNVSRCVGVTQWAVGDADSWVPGAFSGQGAATMFDQNYNPKPAFTSVQNTLAAAGGGGGGGGGGTCHVTYTKNSEWAGGFTAQVAIQNTGTTTINGWSLTFTFPGDQKITSNFNGGFSQTGEKATLTNASYNGTITAGASITDGFQGTWTSNDTNPTGFSVNGTACS